jgi:hypothetical protein
MDSDEFDLLNKKIKIAKEKNKIFRHQRNEINPMFENNYYKWGNNYNDDINNRKFIDLDYENNNTQNFLNNIDISKSNNNQRTFMNRGDLNNYMNNRLVSPSILINRHINRNMQNKKNYPKRLTDIPLSPYLLNKYNMMQKPLNKSNSAINLFNNNNNSNKKSNNKFPSITNNHNSLKSGNSNIYSQNIPNDSNFNFSKTNPIFNFNPKNNNNVFIPIIKNRPIEGIKSANNQKLENSNFKSIDLPSPVSVDIPNKITLDMKNYPNAKKFHVGDKGYGRHYGSEKDCPVCQSVSMKSNYNMKNFHHYHDFIKQRDQNTIKMNKQQFLHELKQPHTKSQKREADIMREIKQFINYTRKTENIGNIDPKDASIINAYFGV